MTLCSYSVCSKKSWKASLTCCLLISRELQRDVKTLRKVVEQLSAQMDSQAVRERPKIAALLEEVNVIKETMNIQVKLIDFP